MCIYESGENYLKAILRLRQSGKRVRAVDIAEHLGYSRASVSKALGNLEQEGYLEVIAHDVYLTEEGRAIAESMVERSDFFYSLLVSVGVDSKVANEEACKLEHCLSASSFRKLEEHLSWRYEEKAS